VVPGDAELPAVEGLGRPGAAGPVAQQEAPEAGLDQAVADALDIRLQRHHHGHAEQQRQQQAPAAHPGQAQAAAAAAQEGQGQAGDQE